MYNKFPEAMFLVNLLDKGKIAQIGVNVVVF